MKKKVVVVSLGGSLIIPNEVQIDFLSKFKRVVIKNTKNYKFVIVCGGGSLARKYISALSSLNAKHKLQSLAGIAATRTNARFMSYLFSMNPEEGIPHKKKEIKTYLKKQDIVFCGALEYKAHQTSDSTAAEIAKEFKTDLINLTNVDGLFNKNPLRYKNAKLIPHITWKEFNKIINKIKFKPGMHFILDHTASKIIMNNKITTYILGKNINNFDNLLKGKKFKGTTISG